MKRRRHPRLGPELLEDVRRTQRLNRDEIVRKSVTPWWERPIEPGPPEVEPPDEDFGMTPPKKSRPTIERRRSVREPETGNSKAPMAPMDALYEVYRVRCGDRSATPELVEELGRTIAAFSQGAEAGGEPHGEAPTLGCAGEEGEG